MSKRHFVVQRFTTTSVLDAVEMVDPWPTTLAWLAAEETQKRAAGALIAEYEHLPKDEVSLIEIKVLANRTAKQRAGFEPTLYKYAEAIAERQGGVVRAGRVPPTKRAGLTRAEAKQKVASSRRLQALAGRQPAPRVKNVGEVLGEIKARKPPQPCNPRFMHGLQLFLTEGVQGSIRPHDVRDAIKRFSSCDWGDVDGPLTRENNRLTHSRRGAIRGIYISSTGKRFHIIANHAENAAVVLLPHEN